MFVWVYWNCLLNILIYSKIFKHMNILYSFTYLLKSSSLKWSTSRKQRTGSNLYTFCGPHLCQAVLASKKLWCFPIPYHFSCKGFSTTSFSYLEVQNEMLEKDWLTTLYRPHFVICFFIFVFKEIIVAWRNWNISNICVTH